MMTIKSNEGKRSFSLLKRILHYTICTMTESRLNDLALMAHYWENHWIVCASKSKKTWFFNDAMIIDLVSCDGVK